MPETRLDRVQLDPNHDESLPTSGRKTAGNNNKQLTQTRIVPQEHRQVEHIFFLFDRLGELVVERGADIHVTSGAGKRCFTSPLNLDVIVMRQVHEVVANLALDRYRLPSAISHPDMHTEKVKRRQTDIQGDMQIWDRANYISLGSTGSFNSNSPP